MSMPELTDDQLDGLFRKSVEEFDTPFDPATWQDMKARLDANDRTTPSGASTWKNLLRWGLPVALLLLLTGASWFVYYNANSNTKLTGSATVASSEPELTGKDNGVPSTETPRLATTERPAIKPVGSSEPKADEVGQVADRGETVAEVGSTKSKVNKSEIGLKKNESSGEIEAGKPLKGKTLLDEPIARFNVRNATKSVTSTYRRTSGTVSRIERSANRPRTTSLLTNRQGSMSDRRPRAVRRNRVPLSGSGYVLSSTPLFTKRSRVNGQEVQPSEVSTTGGNDITPESNEAMSVVLPAINELASKPAQWPKSLAFSGRPVEVQPDTIAQQVTPKLPPMRGLSVRFVVAPDLSSVGLKNFSRPGTNVGLLLEYRLASRWSIQAGVIKSTKVYKALPSEYSAPSTWWQSPMKSPDLVDGRCDMFDIPINIRYDVLIKPRLDGRLPSRWFVSGGVTSYIMKQEEYYYTYPAHTYNQPTEYIPSGGGTGGYGFSNLNLSVGYERSISRRLSWQVEPFMKAPLKGVGFFKVNLLSTGAFFSLRYKL